MTIFYIVFGFISVTIGLIALTYADKISQYLCSAIAVCFGAFMVYAGFSLMGTTTYYLEAEPPCLQLRSQPYLLYFYRRPIQSQRHLP